jgi:hypothetical protein
LIDGPARPFFKAVFLFYSLMNRINRTYPDRDYTLLSNIVFKSDLSARAIGLLCFIMSLPRDWVLHKNWIYQKLPEGRDAINKAWQELEEKKFIICVKSSGSGRGKLPEINYYVCDDPAKHADFSNAENTLSKIPNPKNPRSKNRERKTRVLQSTIEESTIVQSIPVIPDGITVPPPEDLPPAPEQPKKEKEAKQPAGDNDPKAQTIFQLFTSSYDAFFRKLNGVPPQYGKASGSATNSLVAYFRKIAKDRATKDAQKNGGNDPGESYIDNKAHEGWEYVLENWARLDGFLQTKTRLIDINSNIQNIITQLKNGHSKKQTGNSGPTGGNVSTASLAHTIASVYGGAGQ